MKPVVLTRQYDSGRLEAVWVNPEHIVFFDQSGDTRTCVRLGGLGSDMALRVRETPEQISAILERNRCGLRAEERDGIGVAA